VAQLSNFEILDLAYAVGWRGDELTRALNVVLAESSGNTEAVSSTGCCIGLMQINTKVHTSYSSAAMKNPAANMQAGYALYKADGWRPWNSSRGGQWLRATEANASAVAWNAQRYRRDPARTFREMLGQDVGQVGAAAGQAVSAATNVIPGFGEIADAANRLTQWITTPKNIGRIAVGLIGVVVVVGGVLILARPAIEETAKVVKP